MKEVESIEPSDKNWTSKLKELQESIDHHVEEEEGKVFKAAKEVLSDDQAEEIAKKFMEFKKNFKGQKQASMA